LVRIEQGTVTVSPGDVLALLSMYGQQDREAIDAVVDLAHSARDARSWSDYEDILTSAFREMLGQEQSASAIWKYEPGAVPGYFQTSTYTRALLWALGHRGLDLERRIDLRAKRQAILELDPPPEMHVIVGETALARPAGDREVMREQIAHLKEISYRENFHLQLLAFRAGPHRGMGVPFTVLQFDQLNLADSLYLEDADKKTSSHDEPELLENYLRLFNEIRELAEPEETFVDELDRVIAERYQDETA